MKIPDIARPRRATPSTVLAALFLFGTCLPPSAAKVVESTSVAPGLDYARHEEEGLVAHVVKMDLKAQGLHLRSIKAKGKETIRHLAQRMDDQETVVVAGINGDFFRQETSAGLPYGVQVSDGRLIFAPMNRSMIGFGPANEPYIGIVTLRARLTFAPPETRKQAKWAPIDDVNALEGEMSGKNGIYLYTPAFLGLDLARPNGLVAVVEAIQPALQVGDICEGKVARIETSAKPIQVPEAGCLLYFVGDYARALAASVKPGQPVSLKLELPPIAGGVTQAIGGGPRLVRDGKVGVEISRETFDGVHAMEISKRHPRSAIGYDRGRQNLYMVMVEGRQDQSRGMTFGELASFLLKLGCYQAMAFDGGGSAGMYVLGKGVVSRSVGGFNQVQEREVANGLLVTMPKGGPSRKAPEKAPEKDPGKVAGKTDAGKKEARKGEAKPPGVTDSKKAPESPKRKDPWGEVPLEPKKESRD
jgi:hypothetical protein